MNTVDIRKAAALLEARRDMQNLLSRLRTSPSNKIGLYASDPKEDSTMYDDIKLSNEMGVGLLQIAMNANSDALKELGVEEFTS